MLAEFGSVVDAVQCAVVIQTTLRAENANMPQNRRMEFRIGINLGDVVVDGERIYGDGVNIAARMEALAEGGGICVSGMVFEQVKGKVSVNFEDLGLQQVKNMQSQSVPTVPFWVWVRYRLSHRRKSRHRGKTIDKRSRTFTVH